MDFEGLVRHVRSQDADVKSLRVAAEEIRVKPSCLLMGDDRLDLTEAGFGQLCRMVRAPAAYLTNLGDFGTEVLQHHLERGDLADDVTVFAREGVFLGAEKSALERLTASEVLNEVGEAIKVHGVTVHDTDIHDLGFRADILGVFQEEVREGDVIKAGLRIRHSIAGQHATTIEAFLHRLVCRNGLVHRDCVAKRAARTRRLPTSNPRAKELQKAQIRRLAGETWNTLQEKLEAIKELQNETVEVRHLFSSWLRRARISTRLLPQLQEAWAQEGNEPTAYAAMNAMTRIATHNADLSDSQRDQIGVLAGLFAFRRLHLCPRCFSLVNT